MKKFLFLLAVLPFTVVAQNNTSYSYFELGGNFIDANGDNTGYYLNGSIELTDQWYLGAYYDVYSSSGPSLDLYGLKVGYAFDLSDTTDLWAQLEVGQVDTRFGDDETYGLGLGTRTAINDQFEFLSELSYTETDASLDGFFEINLGGLYQFNETVGLKATIGSLDGEGKAEVGIRFSF